MSSSFITRSNIIVALYAIVLGAMVIISKPEAEYPMTMRLFLFGLSMLPVLLSPKYIIFSFACIYAINSTSFCRILPSDYYYYYIIILLTFIYTKKSNSSLFRIRQCVLALLPFYLISLVNLDAQPFQLWWAVALLFIPLLESEENLKLLAFSFPVVSLILSLLFILNNSYFMVSYSVDMERGGWINPNHFGGVVGLGVIVGLALMLGQLRFNISKLEKLFLLVCVSVSYVVTILNASRGSFISVSLVALILVFLSNLKSKYKIIVSALLFAFAFYLWQSGVFELLIYRMKADTARTVGNRTILWVEKIQCFFSQSNIIELFFGSGAYSGAVSLGHSAGVVDMSTHNDYVTALVGFGLFSFPYYIFLLLTPFRNTPKGKERKIMAILMLFFLLESSVLEPMFRGYVPYVMFFTFMYCYSHYLKENSVA